MLAHYSLYKMNPFSTDWGNINWPLKSHNFSSRFQRIRLRLGRNFNLFGDEKGNIFLLSSVHRQISWWYLNSHKQNKLVRYFLSSVKMTVIPTKRFRLSISTFFRLVFGFFHQRMKIINEFKSKLIFINTTHWTRIVKSMRITFNCRRVIFNETIWQSLWQVMTNYIIWFC